MKNWKLNLTLFIVAYVVFFAINVPANMVVSKLTLPQGVKLGEVSGSLWEGKASAVKIKQDYISDLSWQMSPLSLLLGGITADIEFGDVRDKNMISGEGVVSTGFGFDTVALSDFTLRYPANDLANKLQLGLPATFGGRVVLNIDSFDQGTPYCEDLSGTMIWRKAQLQMVGEPIELGKLDAQLGCKAGELELKVTKKNPLGLQMTSLIGANNKFTVKGFVKPNGDMPDSVHNAMSFLGKADSQGRFPLNF